MRYICKFRRNSKEPFWETYELNDLYEFRALLQNIFEGTTAEKLEIEIIKIKLVKVTK